MVQSHQRNRCACRIFARCLGGQTRRHGGHHPMSSSPPLRRLVYLLVPVTAVAVLLASAVPSRAVPVFSRKYQTSCQTCHSAFPKLNPFGEAFRLNGYRMPKETEDQIKQTPVSLGSE